MAIMRKLFFAVVWPQIATCSYIYGLGRMALGVTEFNDTDQFIFVKMMNVDDPGVLRTHDWVYDPVTGSIQAQVEMNNGTMATKCLFQTIVGVALTLSMIDCRGPLLNPRSWIYDRNSGYILLDRYMTCMSADKSSLNLWNHDCGQTDRTVRSQSFFIESAFDTEDKVTLEFENYPGLFIAPGIESSSRYAATLSADPNSQVVFTQNNRVRYVNSSLCLSFDPRTESVYFEECDDLESQMFVPHFFFYDSKAKVAIQAQSGTCLVKSKSSNSITLGPCADGALSESSRESTMRASDLLPFRIYQIGSSRRVKQLITYEPEGAAVNLSCSPNILDSLFLVTNDRRHRTSKFTPYFRRSDAIHVSSSLRGDLLELTEEIGSDFEIEVDSSLDNSVIIQIHGSPISSVPCGANILAAVNWRFYNGPVYFSDFRLVRIWRTEDSCLFHPDRDDDDDGEKPLTWENGESCKTMGSQFVLMFNQETGYYSMYKQRKSLLSLSSEGDQLRIVHTLRKDLLKVSEFAIVYDPSKDRSAILSVRLPEDRFPTVMSLSSEDPSILLPVNDVVDPFHFTIKS